MLSHGPVQTDVDFETHGKRSGFLDLNHSDNAHAFSLIRVPVGVIQGAPGPTVLLSAGSHGDEYEGQVILHQLMQEIEPSMIRGRLIMLPALNTPAVLGRTRVSPLDGGNMNRSFPGDPDSGPTGAIAAYVNAHLIVMADVVLDFHSGGTATEYVDCGFVCAGPNPEMNAANLEIAQVFGAPYTMVCPIDGTGGDFDTSAYRQHTRFLSCELGGMGRFSPASYATGWEGVQRVFAHLGMTGHKAETADSRFIDIGAGSSFATSAQHGLAQLLVSPGQVVKKGDILVTIFDVHNFGTKCAELRASQDGIVAICRRNPLVQPGDHLCQVTHELSPSELNKIMRPD